MAGTAVGGLIIDAVNRAGDTMSGNLVIDGYITASGGLGDESIAVEDNKTLDSTDCGIVQLVTIDAKTITLPATAVGNFFIIMNGGEDGDVEVTISPNASDKIMGNELNAEDDRDVVNTKATAKKGDYIKLLGDGADGWFVAGVKGTWGREAVASESLYPSVSPSKSPSISPSASPSLSPSLSPSKSPSLSPSASPSLSPSVSPSPS